MSNIKDKSPKAPTVSNNVLEVLDVVTRHDFVHIREISRLADLSPTTAGNILKELEIYGVLSKKVLGKNCFYSIKKSQKAKKMIVMLENYRFLKRCYDKSFDSLSGEILKSIDSIKNLIDCVVAYWENSKDERMSLLFITSLDNGAIRSKLSREKILVLTKENFINNLGTGMINAILKDYVVMTGTEKFADMLHMLH